jgi:4-diphosphocytidyl-2-C-methyl-D-erythritol kinase
VIVFPNCKINLGLHILQKREDGFHDLETVFYPIPLQDGLEIIQNPTPTTDVEFSISGNKIDGDLSDNICIKAYHLLKTDFRELPAVKMHLHKTIPSGAGLGGGSADGAFTLLLLNKKFNLGLSEAQLIGYALQLGSDCPFFIKNKPCIAKGRGEKMQEVEISLSAYKIILINPGIHISTVWAFSQIKPYSERRSLIEIIQLSVSEWKEHLTNDFEEVAMKEYPELKNLKENLYSAGAVYAAMSGSGSTFYGIFHKENEPTFHLPSHYLIKTV